MTEPRDVAFEAMGALPNFRYDILQPLLQGRVKVPGIALKPSGLMDSARFFDDARFRQGDFGILDTNWGDVLQQLEAGGDFRCLPVFIKRKPVHAFMWVRTDRGIDAPKDLEGKTIGTGAYRSAISIFTRGFLQHFHGVDLGKLRWLANTPDRADLSARGIHVDHPSDPSKHAAQRLLDGEIDACTGDITNAKLWTALESGPQVRRLFPDYQERTRDLWLKHKIFTPVHLIVIGGKLNRESSKAARSLYDAFNQSKEMAYQDALGDGTSFSPLLNARDAFRDQMRELGDIYPFGITTNRAVIDMFLDYNFEQRLTSTRLSVEQVFAQGALDT
jgi:4,5-dihydroxyphthalate decarboxylase